MALDTILRRTAAALVLVGAFSAPVLAQQNKCSNIPYITNNANKYAVLGNQLFSQHPDGFTVYVGITDARSTGALGSASVSVEASGGSFIPEPDVLAKLKSAGFKDPAGGEIYRAQCK